MIKNRPPVPNPIKRQLRQEAGFGCCKCGFPIYDYHHIVEYSSDQHFRPDDMMILCPNCHREATVGAMQENEQRHYKINPFNILRGYAEGLLKINQNTMVISTGGIQFVNDGFVLMVDEEPLLTLNPGENGALEISLDLYDKQDRLLAVIERNQWISGDPLVWDIEFGYQWLKLRSKSGDITLNIEARTYPITIRADLWRKGQFYRLNKVGLIFNGVASKVVMSELCYVGMYLHADTKMKQFSIKPDQRYGSGMLVSWPDIETRVEKGIAALEQLKKEAKKM